MSVCCLVVNKPSRCWPPARSHMWRAPQRYRGTASLRRRAMQAKQDVNMCISRIVRCFVRVNVVGARMWLAPGHGGCAVASLLSYWVPFIPHLVARHRLNERYDHSVCMCSVYIAMRCPSLHLKLKSRSRQAHHILSSMRAMPSYDLRSQADRGRSHSFLLQGAV